MRRTGLIRPQPIPFNFDHLFFHYVLREVNFSIHPPTPVSSCQTDTILAPCQLYINREHPIVDLVRVSFRHFRYVCSFSPCPRPSPSPSPSPSPTFNRHDYIRPHNLSRVRSTIGLSVHHNNNVVCRPSQVVEKFPFDNAAKSKSKSKRVEMDHLNLSPVEI